MALHEELLATLVVCLARLAAAGQSGMLRKMGLSAGQVERVKALSLAVARIPHKTQERALFIARKRWHST